MLDGVELQLQPEALAALQSFYDEAAAELAQVSRRGPDLPAYHSLEWRLQGQLAAHELVCCRRLTIGWAVGERLRTSSNTFAGCPPSLIVDVIMT